MNLPSSFNLISKSKGISKYTLSILILLSRIHINSRFLTTQQYSELYNNVYRLFMILNKNLLTKHIKDKKKFFDIKLWKGFRLKHNLPIHGQRTKTNSKTAKKLNNILIV
uniref:30S ribosomal protein S13 n=1 Tax=Nephromyces sp. ex Molgula occidentalis TaxID=2544991 RepID=A0A5C1H8Y5_9APIC|nr:30S ribosomal protein S13 [Nephromyces sp. ex Molgula occidentalis]